MNKTTLKIILALLILLALWQSGSYLNGRNRFQQYIDRRENMIYPSDTMFSRE